MTTATEGYWAETHASHASKLVDRFGWQRVVDAAVRRVDVHGDAILDALGVVDGPERPHASKGTVGRLVGMLGAALVALACTTIAGDVYCAWSTIYPQDVQITMTEREPGRIPMTDAECMALYGY